MRRLLLVVGAVVLLGGLSLVPATGNHTWSGYHWARTANPFTLSTGDNVAPAWDPFLDESIADWSRSVVLDLSKVTGSTKNAKTCRPTSGRIEVCAASYGNNGWLGLAQMLDQRNARHAGNREDERLLLQPIPLQTPAWRRLVVCQELAHDFGVDHQDENFNNPNLGSCMDYTSDPDGPPSNEHPNAHDYEQLEIIYKHVDGTSTVGSSTASRGASHDVERQDQWGQARRTDSRGRAIVYERDFGGGRKVVNLRDLRLARTAAQNRRRRFG